MSALPPPNPGRYPTFAQQRAADRTSTTGGIAGMTGEPVQRTAQTLGQFWRSDTLLVPGRRRTTWPGALAVWTAVAGGLLVLGGVFAFVALLVLIAIPVLAIAGFFALVAVIAGLGRGAGVFALLILGALVFFFDAALLAALAAL